MRSVIVTGLSFVILAFWGTYAFQGQLATRRNEAFRRIRPMFGLSGVTLRLDRHVQTPFIPSGPEVPRARYLLLMSSDACHFSQEAVSTWRSLLSTISFRPDDEVLFLSASGTDIPSRLRDITDKRVIRSRLIRLTDPIGFSQETGFGVTPITAALDSNLTVHVVSSRMNPAFVTEVLSYFAGGVQ